MSYLLFNNHRLLLSKVHIYLGASTWSSIWKKIQKGLSASKVLGVINLIPSGTTPFSFQIKSRFWLWHLFKEILISTQSMVKKVNSLFLCDLVHWICQLLIEKVQAFWPICSTGRRPGSSRASRRLGFDGPQHTMALVFRLFKVNLILPLVLYEFVHSPTFD